MQLDIFLEYLCTGLCCLFCLTHTVFSLINVFKQNKRIDYLCDKCGFPVYDGETHKCILQSIDDIASIRLSLSDNGQPNAYVSDQQLKSLQFVLSYLRGISDGNK